MKNWKAELKTMMLDGRWSEAVVLMQNIIKNTPDNPDKSGTLLNHMSGSHLRIVLPLS